MLLARLAAGPGNLPSTDAVRGYCMRAADGAVYAGYRRKMAAAARYTRRRPCALMLQEAWPMLLACMMPGAGCSCQLARRTGTWTHEKETDPADMGRATVQRPLPQPGYSHCGMLVVERMEPADHWLLNKTNYMTFLSSYAA